MRNHPFTPFSDTVTPPKEVDEEGEGNEEGVGGAHAD